MAAEGATVAALLRDGPFSARQSVEVAIAAAEAHLRDPRHGTICAATVRLTPDRRVELLGGSDTPSDEATAIAELAALVNEMNAGRTPEALRLVVDRALAPAREERPADMAELLALLHAARRKLVAGFRRPRRLLIAGISLLAVLAAGGVAWRYYGPGRRAAADRAVAEALTDYHAFRNDRAQASLRAAMSIAPDDPRPYAYLALMGYAVDVDRVAAARDAEKRIAHARPRDQRLVLAATALVTEGAMAARKRLGDPGDDRELQFWSAELAFQAGACGEAIAGYEALLADPIAFLGGRVFDHDVACLLFLDRVADARRVADAYVARQPGSAAALGVRAVTLAAAGQLGEAFTLAEQARARDENDETLAGLAQVHALRGEVARATARYREAIDQAPAWRRPLRRAALALVLLMNDRAAEARREVEPCALGGPEAVERTAPLCLFVAGLAEEATIPRVVTELHARARLAPPALPYGRPDQLARILEARMALGPDEELTPAEAQAAETLLDGAGDLYASYHLPFAWSYVARFRAQIRTMRTDHAGALAALEPVLVQHPADAPVLLQRAGAQAASRDRAAALATLDRLVQLWATADEDAHVIVRARALRKDLLTL